MIGSPLKEWIDVDSDIILCLCEELEEYEEIVLRWGNGADPEGQSFSIIGDSKQAIIVNLRNLCSLSITIAIAHEYGHCMMGVDNLDADVYAMSILKGIHRKLLREMWGDRHGFKYKELSQYR